MDRESGLATLFKKSNLPLLVIIVSTIALSIATFSYSVSVAESIGEIASNDIRSNAAQQSHDLSLILANGIDSITTNLQILSNSPSTQNNDNDAKVLFDVAQDSTAEFTHFYMWLDKDGRVRWISNPDEETNDNIVGSDRSYRDYFVNPRASGKAYFSDVTIHTDGVPRLYVSYPVIDMRDVRPPQVEGLTSSANGVFRGVVVAVVGLDNIASLINVGLPVDSQRNEIIVLDNAGNFLHARNTMLVGMNLFDDRDAVISERFMQTSELEALAAAIRQDSSPVPTLIDARVDGNIKTLATEPVVVDGTRIWTVSVSAVHTLTSDVRVLFDRQNLFSTIIVIIFGILAVGIAVLIIGSNRRLESAIDSKTTELIKLNQLLEESNTKLSHLNEELTNANAQLQLHDKMQREFINIASHEMKTPTQAILFHSDIVKRKPQRSEESVDAIIRNAERLQRLTNNILDVSRIESRTLKLDKKKINLKSIILDLIADFEKQKPMEVEILYSPENIIVEADENRLIQVVSNLMNNALQFTKNGEIRISTSMEDDKVIFSITDSGPGIDSEIMPRLFSKFASRSDKGTGLGLFIAKSIVEAHGGRIWAENKNNSNEKGTTFSFTLPAIKLD